MPIITIINTLIAKVGAVITLLFALLPDSPFIYVMNLESDWIGYINYFLPMAPMVAHIELFLVAVAIYYVIRIALRWAKAID